LCPIRTEKQKISASAVYLHIGEETIIGGMRRNKKRMKIKRTVLMSLRILRRTSLMK